MTDSKSSPAGRKYLVTGSSGHVGAGVLRALETAGESVVVGLRDPARLPPGSRADFRHLDLSDPATFAGALAGVSGVFLMRPPAISDMKKTLLPFISEAETAGVGQCVFLSVGGASRSRFIPHNAVEQRLRDSSLDWTSLRAGFFSQNLGSGYRDDIRDGCIVLPAGHGRVVFVDTRDLGEAAARILREPGQHSAQGYQLTGTRAYSFDEIAALMSKALERDIRYHAASIPEFWLHARRHRGLGRVQTAVMTLLHTRLRKSGSTLVDPALEKLLDRPPRGLEEYISENLDIWR